MSALNTSTLHSIPISQPASVDQNSTFDLRELCSIIADLMTRVEQKIAPVWPLKDYVAVNPYMGFIGQEFLTARVSLRQVSDLETLMSVDYYREQFATDKLSRSDIDQAVDELVADGVAGAERIDVNQVVALLRKPGSQSPTADKPFAKSSNPNRKLRTVTEIIDAHTNSHWSRLVLEEIAKYCGDHYDAGQAMWPSPWRELPLYEAWLASIQSDRTFEILGVPGLRQLAIDLPQDPHIALAMLLDRLAVPPQSREDFLLCVALAMPGWSAWTIYQQEMARRSNDENSDLTGLLTMRMAYEVVLAEAFAIDMDWSTISNQQQSASTELQATDEELLRYALLKASEIAFRRQTVAGFICQEEPQTEPSAIDQFAQMVFCIDVRSERIRRHLESMSDQIETFGFAGFFGMPIEFVPLGESKGDPQVPALVSPQFKVYETIDAAKPAHTQSAIKQRSLLRFLKKTWKKFQTSAASCFAFVETTGLFYGFTLLLRSFGKGNQQSSRFDGVADDNRSRLAPTLQRLDEQGVDGSRQVDMAESVLRGIGIVKNFSRLVVLCGHGSQTENNPLQAGLDCGACCGHSGEPNARFAARLLNQKQIREALAERGILISEETHFVAALHNTTTDEIEFFDDHLLPTSHQTDLNALRQIAVAAANRTRQERLALLPGRNAGDLLRRSRDWSEVRPEWGLAGNAAFIVAPRELTKSVSLEGRSFLHSYDYQGDRNFAVLEQIMTAPLVVANWINMQYYASTVDPLHFGSGNKTVHNVVGRFGVFSGNGGDLMTGLPWQSVHDGRQYQHHPLRLLAVIAAPMSAIDAVIAKHEVVANLVTNGWIQLIAIENDNFFRYTEQSAWNKLAADGNQ